MIDVDEELISEAFQARPLDVAALYNEGCVVVVLEVFLDFDLGRPRQNVIGRGNPVVQHDLGILAERAFPADDVRMPSKTGILICTPYEYVRSMLFVSLPFVPWSPYTESVGRRSADAARAYPRAPSLSAIAPR